MNRQRVLNIIREPLRMEHEKDLPLIKELVEEFPYFSVPYVLLTKLLSEQKSIYLDKYLKLSASYIGNREVLYNFIHSPMLGNETEIAPAFAASSNAEEMLVEEKSVVDQDAIHSPSTHIRDSPKIVEALPEVAVNEEAAPEIDEVFQAGDSDDVAVSAAEVSEPKATKSEAEVETIKNDEEKTDTVSHITDNEKIVQEASPDAKVEELASEEEGEEQQIEIQEAAQIAGNLIHEENIQETVAEKQDIESDNSFGSQTDISLDENPEDKIDEVEEQPVSALIATEEENEAENIESKEEISLVENQPADALIEAETNSKQVARNKLDSELGLPTLAAYDYFAFSEKRKPKSENIPAEKTDKTDEPTETQVSNTEIQPTKIVETAPQKPLKFADWLQSLNMNSPVYKQKNPVVKVVEVEPASETFKQEIIQSKKPTTQEKALNPERKPKRNEVEDLITKFIQSEPRIKPKPAKFFTPQDVAERSAEEDNTLATETLANIYLKQGLNEKAAEIFKQLMLKYPQKSNYFAVKINEINTNP